MFSGLGKGSMASPLYRHEISICAEFEPLCERSPILCIPKRFPQRPVRFLAVFMIFELQIWSGRISDNGSFMSDVSMVQKRSAPFIRSLHIFEGEKSVLGCAICLGSPGGF
ncbi:hypothetical protein CEXT_660251 [Caerostris extrusa]|uniref:Uncharacterized protein n=1 Tax=Caerostris extrusa TaxID=172846 RepID=A0AAV4XSU8_CAEEX|nr:hypothetical protein CEXT_660251 [Caerostris extrusa]